MASGPVEDHLLVECATWNGRTELAVAVSEGFEPRRHFEAQLEALEAIGLLPAREAEDWMRRFDDAAMPDEPLEVDHALRDRVDRYLESLPTPDPFDDQPDRSLEITLQLLEQLTILSEHDAMRWLQRKFRDELEEDEDEDEDEPLRRRELRGVLLGPAEEVAGMRVVDLELYDDGVVVRWTALENNEPALDLADDIGTSYEFTGGEWGSGSGSRVRGESEFTPAAPKRASRLRLNLEGRSFELELGR
jgi:hypothetical protein